MIPIRDDITLPSGLRVRKTPTPKDAEAMLAKAYRAAAAVGRGAPHEKLVADVVLAMRTAALAIGDPPRPCPPEAIVDAIRRRAHAAQEAIQPHIVRALERVDEPAVDLLWSMVDAFSAAVDPLVWEVGT